jgi:hypothetical protein
MTLSFEDQFKFRFVPGSLYYRHKIRSEISSGEPELAVLGRLFTGGDGTVIDVGANRGFYSYALSKLFANVFAFEPNPDLAKFARKKLPHNVEVYEYALGATNEVAQFHIPIGKTGMELPPESGPPTGIDYPSNWRISDGWKTREAGRDCIEASAG